MPGGTTDRRPLASGPSTQRETRLTVRRPSKRSPEPGPDPVAAPANIDTPGSDRSPGHVAVWLARHIKGRNLFAIDLIGIVFAAYLALALRFDQLTGPFAVPELPFVVVLLARGPDREQHPPRPLRPPMALRERPGARGDRRRSGPWVAGEHRCLLRDVPAVERLVGRGVPSLVLVRRDAAQRRDPGRRPIRHPGGIRVRIRSARALARPRSGRRCSTAPGGPACSWPDPPSGTPARTCTRSGSSTTTRTSPAGPSPGSASSAASRTWTGPSRRRAPRSCSSRCRAHPGVRSGASSRPPRPSTSMSGRSRP